MVSLLVQSLVEEKMPLINISLHFKDYKASKAHYKNSNIRNIE